MDKTINYETTILQLAQLKPILPTDITKRLVITTILASAILSELVSKGKLAISNIKLGSSPLYYLPEKSSQLKDYIKYLNEKDQKTAIYLEKEQVLRENEQDSLTKVSLRNIKDFAKPLEVQLGEQKEIFWKWYLLTNQEAEDAIKSRLGIKTHETNLQQVKEEVKKQQEKQHKLVEKILEQPKTEEKSFQDNFFNQINMFFNQNNILVNRSDQIKKNSEYIFDIVIKTSFGELNYYCVAKNKKRISDSDISKTFVQGQMKKLPSLLISNGELTKKASELLTQLKGVAFKKI